MGERLELLNIMQGKSTSRAWICSCSATGVTYIKSLYGNSLKAYTEIHLSRAMTRILQELYASRLCCALIGFWIWSWHPVLAGENAGVEVGIGKASAPCGLQAGDLVEFSVFTHNMTNVRQVLIAFRWQPADAVVHITSKLTAASVGQGFLAPFPPKIEGDQAEFGMASFSAGLEGEAQLANFTFELAPHVTPDTRINIWIEEISLGPSFDEHDIIRPFQAMVLSNYCDANQQVLDRALLVSPEQVDTFFSLAPTGQIIDRSNGETLFSARVLRQGFFLPNQVLIWTIDNQGSSPMYVFTDQGAILIDPGRAEQVISLSDMRGDSFLLMDAEPGSERSVGMAELTACTELEGEQFCASSLITWAVLIPTSVKEDQDLRLPNQLQLGQNYPNPFNAATTIPFSVPPGLADHMRLEIVNLAGQVVDVLLEEHLQPGHHQIAWDGRSKDGRILASGLYFYKLRLGTEELVRPMLLLR